MWVGGCVAVTHSWKSQWVPHKREKACWVVRVAPCNAKHSQPASQAVSEESGRSGWLAGWLAGWRAGWLAGRPSQQAGFPSSTHSTSTGALPQSCVRMHLNVSVGFASGLLRTEAYGVRCRTGFTSSPVQASRDVAMGLVIIIHCIR